MVFNVDIEPVVLRGNTVKLVPIRVEHAAALYDSTREIEWKMLPTNFISSSQMESWIRSKISERINKTSMHFSVMLAKNEKIVGSTGFMDILPEHRILEIGSTTGSISTLKPMLSSSRLLNALISKFSWQKRLQIGCKALNS